MPMKKLLLIPLVFSFFVFLYSAPVTLNIVFAEDSNVLTQQLQDKQAEITKLEEQLADTRKQEKTLKSQLNLIDGQTKVTQLKIEETNLRIEKLQREINDLATRITRIGATLDTLSEILLQRIVQTYKYSNAVSTIDLLFSSHGISDLLERLKYIQVAQAYDKQKLYELQATKLAYNDQKQDKQTRQKEAEKLNKDLEVYKVQLTEQKKAKDELLRITKNDEAIYQQKIILAQQEQNAILQILSGGGNEVSVGPKNQGDVIGYMISGPSACSSGTHVHFEAHQNNAILDPNNFLSPATFTYKNNEADAGSISPHGSWDWPIFNPIFVTQGYGMTPYARAGAYNGGPHTGIDMYSSSGLTVKAVKSGNLSKGGIACGGGTLHYDRVDHDDGTSAYYLHVL